MNGGGRRKYKQVIQTNYCVTAVRLVFLLDLAIANFKSVSIL